jgi:tetratricopeptide (TPR) repeat protein
MLLQIEILFWVVSVLVIIGAPLIWLWRFIMRKYYPQQEDIMIQDVTDDILESDELGEDGVLESDEWEVEEEIVVHIDPVIAAMRQEEQEFAREQQNNAWAEDIIEENTKNEQTQYVLEEDDIVEDYIAPKDNIIEENIVEHIQDHSQNSIIEEQVIEDVIDIIELDTDDDGEIDAVATIHTTAPADLIEAKRQKSIEMLQFELRNLKEKWQASAHEKKLIEARALHPERDEFTTMLAEHYYEQSEYKKSLWLYRKMVDADSSDDKSLAMIANCYIKLGEWENAQVILEKLVQDRPENPRYWMSLAEVYYNFKQLDQTIDCVRTMVKLRPTNMDYLSTLAQLYHETQNYEPYVQILYRMLELDPLNHEIKAEIEKYS